VLWVFLLSVAFGSLAADRASPGRVHVVSVQGVINPVSARQIAEGIERAAADSAAALVIELDTPGGLLKSVHEISKAILAAGVPVIVYVAPEGARATSAGVLVTISAHVAVMARGTHIGAAHVVTLEGAIQDSIVNEKAMNDWVAELRSVARMRGRNEAWVERAARESASLVAADAVTEGVADLMADDLPEVLRLADGRRVQVRGDSLTIETAEAEIVRIEPSFRDRFLSVVSDPSVAYVLFLIGIYGLIFELSSPGSIVPGVVGAIAIVLALYSMHSLPINYAGVILILLAIGFFIAETQVHSFGLLAVGGIVSLVLGSIMLFDRAGPLFRISMAVIVPAAFVTTVFFLVVVSAAWRARRRKPMTGREGLVGSLAVVERELAPDGKVFVHGELWNARAAESIEKGRRVRVRRMEGMWLVVEPAEAGGKDEGT
jgi:membrane-bound serine protease (ClpP class)